MQMNKEQFRNKVFDFFYLGNLILRRTFLCLVFSCSTSSFASETEFCHSSDQDAKETDIDFFRGHAYLPPRFF